MRSQIILLLASMLAMTPPASAGLFESVRPNIMDLVAKDSGAKSGARDIIQKQFELSPAPERITATDELLKKIQAASDSTEKAAAAVALAKLKSPWEASNHNDQVAALYKLYLETKDPSLGRYLDDALSNAKGLYLDGINDFNSDNVSNPVATAAKFQRMADSFPKSRYASSSAYYIGQYWTRVGFIQNNFSDSIPKSDTAFTNFIKRSKNGDFPNTNFLTDATCRSSRQAVFGRSSTLYRARSSSHRFQSLMTVTGRCSSMQARKVPKTLAKYRSSTRPALRP